MKQLTKLTSTAEITANADHILVSEGYHAMLGFRHISWNEKRVEIALTLQPHHLNRSGILHGGVLASLLDIACAQAGTFCPYKNRVRKAITLSLTTSFTGQCSQGEIRIVGKLRAFGTRIYNSSGEIFDEQGNLLAMGEGTFRLRSGSEQREGVETH